MLTNRIMSLDVESNGLWGKPISIGFTIENNGRVIFKAEACYIDNEKRYDEWVQEYVIKPIRKNENILHLSSYEELLQWFAKYYNMYRRDYTVLYHMGNIVEANLFKELVSHGYIGEYDAPYTPIEVSMLLALCRYDMDSVDNLVKLGLIEKPSESQTHQALYDAEVAGRAYWFLKRKLLGENTEKSLGERIYDELVKLEKMYPHLNVCNDMKEKIKSFRDDVNRVPINFYDIYDIPQGQGYHGRHSTYYRVYIENTMTNEEIYQVIEESIKNRQPFQVETTITDIDESRRLNINHQNYLKEKALEEQKGKLKEKENKKRENISSLRGKRNIRKERSLLIDFLSLLGLED